MLKALYLSPLGYLISLLLNLAARLQRPFMVYGYYCRAQRKFLRHTRVSSSATLVSRRTLSMGDHCWIWHHSIVDASGGVVLGEGVQIGAWVGIFTHSSDVSIRLLGREYLATSQAERTGYINAPVAVGDYTFIGSGSVIMPGAKIGKGCLIGVGSIVKGEIPDFSIATGNPARVVGSTDFFDRRYLDDSSVARSYFDPQHWEFLQATYRRRKDS
jgi:acetyltransferase-like isoleucine patch superfamily enzyme